MNLQLSLKKKWFEMTKSGIKTEDYRELSAYWYSRLCLYNGIKKNQVWWEEYFRYAFAFDKKTTEFINFTQNTMTLGYPSSTDIERILKFEHAGIEIRTGNPDWGAEPNKLYFVIKHGVKL
jgi:hypothetical protein